MADRFEVAESVFGVYCYHIRHAGQHRSLCGRLTMDSLRPLEGWKKNYKPDHIPIKYCDACDKIFKGMGHGQKEA